MNQTREEFESEYNDGDIMPFLLAGRLSIECRCDDENCKGWKMSDLTRLSDDLTLYGNTLSEVHRAVDHRLNRISIFKLRGKA